MIKHYKLINFDSIDFQLNLSKGTIIADTSIHTHDFVELSIVTHGNATHFVEGKEHKVQRGDVTAIIPPFQHGHIHVHNLENYNFMFDLNQLLQLYTELNKLSGFSDFFLPNPSKIYRREFASCLHLNEDQLNFAISLCELMLSEFHNRNHNSNVVIKTYFFTLITFLSTLYEPDLNHSNVEINKLDASIEYIETHYSEKISIKQLAEMSFTSERHYSRLFKQFFGKSPNQYIIDCRLAHACKLLLTTNITITEISARCGFVDKIYFTKMFKSKYHITPSEYRK